MSQTVNDKRNYKWTSLLKDAEDGSGMPCMISTDAISLIILKEEES